MKYILTEDADKFVPLLLETIRNIGNGAKKVEYEVEIGKDIANILGYWVGDIIRIDIKFRE